MTSYDLIERPERDQLGEAIFWDEAGQALYWVDIVGKRVHQFDPSSGELRRWSTPRHVSAAIPSARGGLMTPMTHGLHRLDTDSGDVTLFARPDTDEGNRSNETRTDARGRIWLGTMCNNLGADGAPVPLTRSSGGVFCIEADGRWTQLLWNIGITNAFAWSPGQDRFYCADTPKGLVWSFTYDPDGPALSDRQVFIEGGPGKPDGAAMDEDGCLWVARWGGSRVIRYTPEGVVDREIELPVKQPSCCAFGGPDRRTLFITTARQELEGLAPDALDGSVFMVRVETPGMPMPRFGG